MSILTKKNHKHILNIMTSKHKMHHKDTIEKINLFLVKSGITNETANSFKEGCEIIYRNNGINLLISFFDEMDLTVSEYNDIIQFCLSPNMNEDDIIEIYDKIKDSIGDDYRYLIPCVRRFPRAILHVAQTLTDQKHIDAWNNNFSCTIAQGSGINIVQFLTDLSRYHDPQTTGELMLEQLCRGGHNNLYDQYATSYNEHVFGIALGRRNNHVITDQINRAFQANQSRYNNIYSIHRYVSKYFEQIMKHFHLLFNVNTFDDFICANPKNDHEIYLQTGPLYSTMSEIIRCDSNGLYIDTIHDIINTIRNKSHEFVGQWNELIENLESWNKIYHGQL